MLTGSDQKIRGMDRAFLCRPAQSTIPPVNRQTLSHLVKLAKHGKPDYSRSNAESVPQGKPMGEQAEEVGESKSHSVMEWIRAYALTRKGADFRLVLNHENEFEKFYYDDTDRRWHSPLTVS